MDLRCLVPDGIPCTRAAPTAQMLSPLAGVLLPTCQLQACTTVSKACHRAKWHAADSSLCLCIFLQVAPTKSAWQAISKVCASQRCAESKATALGGTSRRVLRRACHGLLVVACRKHHKNTKF
jgi:hypothetical protein